MLIKRLLVSAIGLPALIAGALLATTPAQATTPTQAAAPAQDTSGVRWVRLPAAPAASSAGLRATAPSANPAPGYTDYAPGSIASCSRGVLCTAVWNPVNNKWRQFNLAACNLYRLAYWQGGGSYFDNQTGGVTSYFYGQTGNELHHFTPDQTQHAYNWDNVYSIRNC